MTDNTNRPICDYEGSAYRTEFWGQDRAYEDAAERAALRALLPSTGARLVDIGGGYGRLMPLYSGYDEVIIFDYALTQLRQAQELWGDEGPNAHPRYLYVAGDFYNLPFAPAAFDTVVMVRTLHHATDAPSVLRGISQILASHGSLVLEFANKRNLKAILRYLARRQTWSPFDRAPVEFVSLNFDFHPAWVEEKLREVGLRVRKRRAVSTFRLDILKRSLPTDLLVTLDRALQPTGALFPLSPSVFLRCEAKGGASPHVRATPFRCTTCGTSPLEEGRDKLSCAACGASFPIRDGIYNFKAGYKEAGETSGGGGTALRGDGEDER
jgi:ubiquinone/menaquinone biosynthesis C-methylase UbiE